MNIWYTKRKWQSLYFDASPVIEGNKDFIVLDVMNVHHGNYYQGECGGTPPGDWMNLTLIFFLTVEKEVKFIFALAPKNGNLARISIKLLKEALKNFGIEAKLLLAMVTLRFEQ